MDKYLKVEYGTIYTQGGIGIDNIAMIFDRNAGCLKYGDSEKGDIKSYYEKIQTMYRKGGLDDIADDILYIEFDRYDGILSIEEICTFMNYILMVSANGDKIMKMLEMGTDELKEELIKLSEIGF